MIDYFRGKKAVVIAIVAGAVAVLLVNIYVNRVKEESKLKTIKVIRANRPLNTGQTFTQDMVGEGDTALSVVTFPEKHQSSISGALTPGDLSTYEGEELKNNIDAGQLLTFHHFESGRPGLNEMVSENKRAISIQVTEDTSVSGFIQPGDTVDVLVTYTGGLPYSDNEESGQESETRVLLSRANVLATGGYTTKTGNISEGEQRNYDTITLEVTLEAAAKVEYARNTGGILSFVLRNKTSSSHHKLRVSGRELFDQ